jgi:hypothetical protein
MQSRDPLTRLQRRAVVEHEVPTRAVDLKAENARRMLGIFQYRLMTPQSGIQRKNGRGQPGMTVRRLRPFLYGIRHRHQRVSAFSCPLRATSHAEKVPARQPQQYSQLMRGQVCLEVELSHNAARSTGVALNHFAARNASSEKCQTKKAARPQ